MIITTFKSEFERIAAIVGAGFTTKEIQEEQEFAQNYDFTIQPWINWKPLLNITTEYGNDGVMYYQGQCELYFLTKANTYDALEDHKDVLIDQMIDLAEAFFANLDKNAERRFVQGQFDMTHEIQRQYLSNYLVGTKATIRFNTACNRFVPASDPVPDYLFKYTMNGDDVALTPINSPSIVSGPAFTDLLAKRYNGVDQWEQSSDFSTVAIGANPFSITAWVKTTNDGNSTTILANGLGLGANEFTFRKGGNNKIQLLANAQGFTDSNSVVNTGEWIHVALVMNGSGTTYDLYLNGVIDKSGSAVNYDIGNTGVLGVAAEGGTGFSEWEGDLDDIRFYNRALSAEEVSNIKDYSNE